MKVLNGPYPEGSGEPLKAVEQTVKHTQYFWKMNVVGLGVRTAELETRRKLNGAVAGDRE